MLGIWRIDRSNTTYPRQAEHALEEILSRWAARAAEPAVAEALFSALRGARARVNAEPQFRITHVGDI